MRRIARDCGWERLVAHGCWRERGESRPLGDKSEPLVRLLAGAYRAISKQLGDSPFSGGAGHAGRGPANGRSWLLGTKSGQRLIADGMGASRLKRSRLRRGCFDGRAATAPLAAALISLGRMRSPTAAASTRCVRWRCDRPAANALQDERRRPASRDSGRAGAAGSHHDRRELTCWKRARRATRPAVMWLCRCGVMPARRCWWVGVARRSGFAWVR
jgi:hypothetical protein